MISMSNSIGTAGRRCSPRWPIRAPTKRRVYLIPVRLISADRSTPISRHAAQLPGPTSAFAIPRLGLKAGLVSSTVRRFSMRWLHATPSATSHNMSRASNSVSRADTGSFSMASATPAKPSYEMLWRDAAVIGSLAAENARLRSSASALSSSTGLSSTALGMHSCARCRISAISVLLRAHTGMWNAPTRTA
jgi:hypothetical protein